MLASLEMWKYDFTEINHRLYVLSPHHVILCIDYVFIKETHTTIGSNDRHMYQLESLRHNESSMLFVQVVG